MTELLINLIQAELRQAQAVLDQFMADPTTEQRIEQAARLIAPSLREGGKVLSCGNGGSLCDAQHVAEELTGRYRQRWEPVCSALAIF